MYKAVLLTAVLTIGSAFAGEVKNEQILKDVLEKIETSYNLKCEAGRDVGEILNPLICSIDDRCCGKVKYNCTDAEGEKQFKVKAVFKYNSWTRVELKKVEITAK